MARQLGKRQAEVLRILRAQRSWYPQCGWVYGTPSNTVRVLDSLVLKRLATKTQETRPNGGGTRPVYRPANLETVGLVGARITRIRPMTLAEAKDLGCP